MQVENAFCSASDKDLSSVLGADMNDMTMCNVGLRCRGKYSKSFSTVSKQLEWNEAEGNVSLQIDILPIITSVAGSAAQLYTNKYYQSNISEQ